MRTFELSLRGRRCSVTDTGGDVAPLLLLHGYPLSSRLWAGQLAGLPPRARVIAPDLSGLGRSEVPADPAAYSMDRWADEAAALLDALGLARAAVGGLSMGGYVALAFARRHPERLAGLALLDTRAGADTEAGRAGRTAQQELARAKGVAPIVEAMVPKLVPAEALAQDPSLAGRVRALMEQATVDGVVGALEAMKLRPDSTPCLPSIAAPTLVLVGARDELTPPAEARAMAAAIPGARLVELPGCGHLAPFEHPAAANAELTDWLGRCVGAGR